MERSEDVLLDCNKGQYAFCALRKLYSNFLLCG